MLKFKTVDQVLEFVSEKHLDRFVSEYLMDSTIEILEIMVGQKPIGSMHSDDFFEALSKKINDGVSLEKITDAIKNLD